MEAEEFWYQDPALLGWDLFDDAAVKTPSVVVDHMTHLFTNFADVVDAFSLPQINAGIWAMFGPDPFVLHKHLWLPSVPLSNRTACIASMYVVYSGYVSKSQLPVMENCFSMWWDFIATGFWEYVDFTEKIAEGDVTRLSREQLALLDSLFETLSKILALPDWRTQQFALHGLGHLHHPGVRGLVQNFLNRHRPDLSPEGMLWIEQCRDGTVM